MSAAKKIDEPAEALSERILLVMTKAMVEDINDYRFKHRINSRAEAVRAMIDFALAEDKKTQGN